MSKPKPKFWNNDLNNIVLNKHNKFHFFASLLGSLFLGFGYTYSVGIGWEVYNGVCPWWDDPKWKHYNTDKGIKAWIIANLFLSDKFSWQDAIVWDLGGAMIGQLLRCAMIYYGIFEIVKGVF